MGGRVLDHLISRWGEHDVQNLFMRLRIARFSAMLRRSEDSISIESTSRAKDQSNTAIFHLYTLMKIA